MTVAPTKGRLQHGMQAVETNAERHLDASHHGGLNILESDLQARDFGGGAHARKFSRILLRPQFKFAIFHTLLGCARNAEQGCAPARAWSCRARSHGRSDCRTIVALARLSVSAAGRQCNAPP